MRLFKSAVQIAADPVVAVYELNPRAAGVLQTRVARACGAAVLFQFDQADVRVRKRADQGPGVVGAGVVHHEDFQAQAIANVEGWFGPCPNYRIESRSSYDGIELESIDRALLDLPEPWHVVPHLEQCLVPGGVMVSYLPTITQTAQLRQTLETLAFSEIRSLEVLHRGWHIEGLSVRPDHRMVAHTGFLTVARRAEPSGSV